MRKLFENNTQFIRISSLKTFTDYYEGLDNQLKSWIFSSIRAPYLSILNFDDLRIDMTDSVSFFTSESEIKDKYIRLEVVRFTIRPDLKVLWRS
jgi:hypothetical protein